MKKANFMQWFTQLIKKDRKLFESNVYIKEYISKKVKRVDVIKGRCDLTELGFSFLRACGYSLQTK